MDSNANLFSTGTFHFQLGEPPQSFRIHAELVARRSPFLKTLMTGPMHEARDKVATVHNVDVDSFTRFAEYAYSGDYNGVEPTSVTTEACENTDDDFTYSEPVAPVYSARFLTKKSKKSDREAASKQLLGSLEYGISKPYVESFPAIYMDSFAVQTAQQYNARYDFTEVLLCHARVYVMADRFRVPALKELAIYKIHQLLKNIIASDQSHVGDLVSILEYVYSNTMGLESAKDPLRDLLAEYAARKFRSRMEEQEFQDFLSGNRFFACDVCMKVSLRL